jgi:hypothetical protein
MKGAGAISGGKNKTPMKYRMIYPSYIGRLDINACSATDSIIVFPNGHKLNLSELKRTFKLMDFLEVEDSLKKVSGCFIEQTATEENTGHEVTNLVESFLNEFKSQFNSEKDYLKAVAIIENYFSEFKAEIGTPIFIKSGNIKKLAHALGEIWRSKRNDVITYEYLVLYRQVFSIFESQKIDRNNIMSSNLYKYSISKT